jgi:uncharacterized protein YcbK (DUF882 family)
VPRRRDVPPTHWSPDDTVVGMAREARAGLSRIEEVRLALPCCRRSFLKGSLIGASALFARLPTPGAAFGSSLPPGELALYNTHTGEHLEVTYRDGAGCYDPAALTALDRILRCHYTGQVARMDRDVIEFLNLVQKKARGDREVQIISGFRSAAYNDWLIAHGHGVAKHSFHLVAKAIDIRISGVPLDAVRRTALDLGLGGVGYYPASEFVHLDSGRRRSW